MVDRIDAQVWNDPAEMVLQRTVRPHHHSRLIWLEYAAWEVVVREHSATPDRPRAYRATRWLPGNVQYETIMGWVAYGVSSTSNVEAV